MNWKLRFTKSHTLVEIFNDKKEVIFSRVFKGWMTKNYEDTILVPKFELNKGESISVEDDNVYINGINKK